MHEHERENEWRRQRGNFISLTMTGIVAAGIITFSIAVCGGAAIYAILTVLGFTALGACHYVLWGRRLSEETDEERRAEELRHRLENEAWGGDEDEPHRYRRF